jgi:hypothetical protein
MGDKVAARKSYQDFLTLCKTPIPTSPSTGKSKPSTRGSNRRIQDLALPNLTARL